MLSIPSSKEPMLPSLYLQPSCACPCLKAPDCGLSPLPLFWGTPGSNLRSALEILSNLGEFLSCCKSLFLHVQPTTRKVLDELHSRMFLSSRATWELHTAPWVVPGLQLLTTGSPFPFLHPCVAASMSSLSPFYLWYECLWRPKEDIVCPMISFSALFP